MANIGSPIRTIEVEPLKVPVPESVPQVAPAEPDTYAPQEAPVTPSTPETTPEVPTYEPV